jgi:hypothetical protein
MNEPNNPSDLLLQTCEALLREIASYPITSDRLLEALPLIKDSLAAIRRMDEVDVSGLEPMTVVRLTR